MNKFAVVLAVTTPLLLVACGGGGGSSTTPEPTTPTPIPITPTPTTPTPTTPSGPKSQTINALTTPYGLSVGSSETLSISATSGLPVSYEITTPSICSISGATLTGLAIGTCSFVVSQSGDTNFTAAPSVTYSVQVTRALLPQAISNFSIPALSVNTQVVISPVATSGLPISIVSLTPNVCYVQNRLVLGLAVGTCKLEALQNGNSFFASALSVYASVPVATANNSLVANAVIGSWMTTPEAGSSTLDSSEIAEGLYVNPVGDLALIDGANQLIYNDSLGVLVGIIQPNTSTWGVSSSALYYSDPNASISATASGSFVTKQSFVMSTQSFSNTTHLSLSYSPSNGFAASQSSVAGIWIFDNGLYRYVLNISNMGTISGIETNAYADDRASICDLSGSIVQSELVSQHNMYRMTLSASGASCKDIQTTEPFTGLAALSFSAAGSATSNGYIPLLIGSLIAPTTKARMSLLLY